MDSNKGVVRATLSVLYEIALAIKKPNFDKHAKLFYSTVLQILGDGTKQNRDDALRCAQAFADNSHLSTTLSSAAAALLGEKDSPALRREVLTFLNERLAVATPQEFSAAGDGLQAIIRPALACALDKQGDVRKLAEVTLSVVAKHVPHSSFEHHLERYTPSQKDVLAKILAKFYKPAPSTTTTTASSTTANASSAVPSSPSSSSLLKSVRKSPIKRPVTQQQQQQQHATASPKPRGDQEGRASPSKKEQGLLLVDPVQKAMRSKSKALYDARMLGSVAGRQNLRDFLKGGLLADPSETAQMFSQDSSVLAQTLTGFLTLVDRYPTSAANSSDLLIMWSVTTVMSDTVNDPVFINSFALLVKNTPTQ